MFFDSNAFIDHPPFFMDHLIFPASMRHRNWNGGSKPTVHLAFNTPLPDPNVPFAKSV